MKNVLDDIPVSGDYCSILVKLMDSSGGACENTKINCKDGTRWYNYTTNESGYALFKCNSGAANITPNNFINGIRTFDQDSIGTLNIDSPVGTKILKEIKFNKNNKFYRADAGWYNGQFRSIDRINNVIVVGGGGGGGANGGTVGYAGGGGGGGAKNFASYIDIVRNQLYNLYNGDGGDGDDYDGKNSKYNHHAMSGSTTIAFGLSANGGGGCQFISNGFGVGGIGLYNGGNGGKCIAYQNANIELGHGKDGINGAGGGGAGWCYINYEISKPYAHNGNNSGNNGSGGGGIGYGYTAGMKGYSGRIEFEM